MADGMLILSRAEVIRCLVLLDPVEVIAEVLRLHAGGHTTLPAEGYLTWQNSQDQYSRALAMLGAITPPDAQPSFGMKLMNASVGNPALGMERAGGFTVLFDPETARPVTLLEAGHLSALRTAAYTICSLRELGPERVDRVSIIGCGTLARMHVSLLERYFPDFSRLSLFDLDGRRAAELVADQQSAHPQLEVVQAPSARACFGESNVVITLTTSNQPYAEVDWIRAGTMIAHVSLDDVGESVFTAAEAIYVDDLELVAENPRRILGQLLSDGVILSPRSELTGPRVAGSLCDVLAGNLAGRRPGDGFVVSNPFGMSVLDVGLATAVAGVAQRERIGTFVDLLG